MEWTTKKHNDCPTCRQPLAAVDPSRSQAIEHVVSHVRIVIPNPRDVYAQTREPDRRWERCNQFVFTCCGIAVVALMLYFLIA